MGGMQKKKTNKYFILCWNVNALMSQHLHRIISDIVFPLGYGYNSILSGELCQLEPL